jgi:hypothetical protein
VQLETIRKCWQHAQFNTELFSFSEEIKTDFIPLEDLDGWGSCLCGLPFTDLIECDHDAAICSKRTDSEIVAEVIGLSDHSDSEHNEEVTGEKSAPPSFSDAISALATLKAYLCTRKMSEVGEGCLSQIVRLLYDAGDTRKTQTTLYSFPSNMCV